MSLLDELEAGPWPKMLKEYKQKNNKKLQSDKLFGCNLPKNGTCTYLCPCKDCGYSYPLTAELNHSSPTKEG